MSTLRETPEPAAESESPHSGVSTAPAPRRRNPPKRPALKPLETTTARPTPEAGQGSGAPAAATIAGPAAPPPLSAPGALAGQAAAMPMAAAAMGALGSIAAGYGTGSPSADTGRS